MTYKATYFTSVDAYSARPGLIECGTADEFADYLRSVVVPVKDDAPLLKLALFNGHRCDENVVEFYGAQGDADSQRVTVQEAHQHFQMLGIEAVFHATHGEGIKPHHCWRVFARFSESVGPERFHELVSLLNGVLRLLDPDATFAAESWTPHQPFFIGSGHEVLVSHGKPIDHVEGIEPADNSGGRKVKRYGAPPVAAMAFAGMVSPTDAATRERLLGAVRNATEGGRHAKLFGVTKMLYRLVSGGRLDPEGLEDEIMAAATECGIGGSINNQITRGIAVGMADPLTVEREADEKLGGVPTPPPACTPLSNEQHQALDAAVAKRREEQAALTVSAGRIFTQEGVAQIAALRYADMIRVVPAEKDRWYVWQPERGAWRRDDMNIVKGMCYTVMNEMANAADAAQDQATAKELSRKGALDGMRASLAANPALTLPPRSFDQDGWLLGVPGGVVDLRDGNMRHGRPEDMISKQAAVAPSDAADCPVWFAHLDRVTGGDKELIAYLKRWYGYMLTGVIREHELLFFYGEGRNGKGITVNTVQYVMGDYAYTAPAKVFQSDSDNQHPADVAKIPGYRLVTAQEIPEGAKWHEARIKMLTGGDRIPGRNLYGDPDNFEPTAKFNLVANSKPELRKLDVAIQARFNLVPFNVTIPESERVLDLSEQLKIEAPGILRWQIDGCLEWQKDGLGTCVAVKAATEAYFAENDPVGRWLGENVVGQPGGRVSSKDLHDDYQRWAMRGGERHIEQRQLTSALKGKGLHHIEPGSFRGFEGIAFRNHPLGNVRPVMPAG